MAKVKVNIKDKVLQIEKGKKKYKFELKKVSERLAKATDEELKDFAVSPSGYGIHWYKIDEDISIPSLLNEPMEPYGKKK
jgi:hypothetical protein